MVKAIRKRSWRRFSVCVVVSLGLLVLAVAVLLLSFERVLLNSYGKRTIEQAFAKSHPGSVVIIGELDYSLASNCLVAQSVTLRAANATLRIGRSSLIGVCWAQLLWGANSLPDVLAKGSLDATNLLVDFPQAHYGLRAAHLRASVPSSELIVEGAELQTLAGDAALFAAHEFRTTRFHVIVPECRILGLVYGDLLRGTGYRARSARFSKPFFDALVDCDKPTDPFDQPPLMVHEALAAIRLPLQIDSLTVTNGQVRYCERMVAGAEPGVLTFADVNLVAAGIANRGQPSAAILLRAQGKLMNAAVLKVEMTIPIAPDSFSFRYSGSLSALDLTGLDAFLDIAEHLRIKSGIAKEVAFDIDVAAGQARGRVRGIYRDLEIAILDKRTGTEKGVGNRLASLLANTLKIRPSNTPDAVGDMKEGEVNYAKRPSDEFLQFAWFALRSGVLDLISH